MVRIGIEASERIGLACEAEAVAGPALACVVIATLLGSLSIRLAPACGQSVAVS